MIIPDSARVIQSYSGSVGTTTDTKLWLLGLGLAAVLGAVALATDSGKNTRYR